MDNVLDAMRKPFLDAATDIHGAIVYLDAGAAEVAQLSLGPAFLFGLGAANVCDLERSHPDDGLLPSLAAGGQPATSLAVFTTQLLTDTHSHMVRLLMVHPHARRCLLFCAVSELAHAQLDASLSPLGVEAYREYAAALRQDVAAARAAAGLAAPREDQLQLGVRHLPLHITALDASTFVLPAAGAVASKAVAGGRAAGFAGTDARPEDDADADALGASTGLSLLPHALADLSRLLGARLEPFALGPVSAAVARELAALPQQGGPRGGGGMDGLADGGGIGGGPGSATAGAIGLVLVDRSLDLATPVMHADHVLDVMFSSLPRAEAVQPPPQQQPPAGAPPPPYRAALRPADYRVDVPQLAPLVPLVPAPEEQQPAKAAAAAAQRSSNGPDATDVPSSSDGGVVGGSSSSSSSSSRPNEAALPPLVAPMGLGLFHPSDRRWLAWLAQLWPKLGRDALLLLRKWLKEAVRAEKLSPATRSKLSSVVAPAELLGLAQCLLAQPGVFLRHQPVVGLALAAAAALSTDGPAPPGSPGPPWAVWGRLAAVERQLLLALPPGSEREQMLKPVLLEAIASSRGLQQRRLLFDHVLQLLVASYSLCGDRMPPAPPLYSADEAELRDALANAVMEAVDAVQQQQQQEQEQQQQQWPQGVELLRLECLPQAQQLLMQALQSGRLPSERAAVHAELVGLLAESFQRLRWLAAARGKLRDVRRLMQVDADTGAASSATPLLRQVLTKILLQADNRDLQQPESGSLVAGLLHRGLGRLGFGGGAGPARPRISDYAAVLLFVVGGVSAAEVREVRQELEEHKFGHKPLVLLGGTSLLAPADAARLLLS